LAKYDAVVAWRNVLGILRSSERKLQYVSIVGRSRNDVTVSGLENAPTTTLRTTRLDWSGCRGGMKNAVLGIDDYPQPCYRSEHAYEYGNETNSGLTDKTDFLINGTQIWERLAIAKSRGTLFARKFNSGNESSMQLLQQIVHELH
jgi:hypothetical protein